MKKLSLFILGLTFSTMSFAQFNFDGGASLVLSNLKKQNLSFVNDGTTVYERTEMSALGFGVFLHPRLQVSEFGNFGIAIGSPSNIALEGNASTNGESSLNALLDLNLTVDLLGGGFKADGDYDAIGYYAGIGLGFTGTTNSGISAYNRSTSRSNLYEGVDVTTYDGSQDAFDDLHRTSTTSLFLHAGVGNISIGNFIQNMGVRAGIKPGLSSSRLTYYTISVFKTFGRNN